MNVEQFRNHEINRRQFLGSSAKNAAAGMAVGMVGLAGAVAKAAANDRVRVGVIGLRNQGKDLASGFAELRDVEVAVLCDVDESVFAPAVRAVEDKQHTPPRVERDFRRVIDDRTIDAVVIATPDHWHVPMAMRACLAGKDVYVEKPVSHAIAEGAQLVAAARKHERIVQSGLQQRSGNHFQSAVEFVRSGKLGHVSLAKAWTIHRRKSIGFKKDCEAPAGVDYELWLGPAPERAFNPNRFHYNWHWFWDYGSGELGNWGTHMLDVARWGLGVEWPDRVSATGGKYYFNDDQETPDTQVVHYTYPDKTIIWEHRLWSAHGIEGRSAAAAFYGDNGTLVVDRGGWKVYDQKETTTADTSDSDAAHYRNFVDCIKSRELPSADIAIGHVSSGLGHLGNIAYRLGRDVTFDSESGNCGWDGEANALLAREYRRGWELPVV